MRSPTPRTATQANLDRRWCVHRLRQGQEWHSLVADIVQKEASLLAKDIATLRSVLRLPERCTRGDSDRHAIVRTPRPSSLDTQDRIRGRVQASIESAH